jgi:hypothetical protein
MAMRARLAVDAWAQPCMGKFFAHAPEVERLLVQSGGQKLLQRIKSEPESFEIGPKEMISLMDNAGALFKVSSRF